MSPTLLQASLFLALVLLVIVQEIMRRELRRELREKEERIASLREVNKALNGQLDQQQYGGPRRVTR